MSHRQMPPPLARTERISTAQPSLPPPEGDIVILMNHFKSPDDLYDEANSREVNNDLKELKAASKSLADFYNYLEKLRHIHESNYNTIIDKGKYNSMLKENRSEEDRSIIELMRMSIIFDRIFYRFITTFHDLGAEFEFKDTTESNKKIYKQSKLKKILWFCEVAVTFCGNFNIMLTMDPNANILTNDLNLINGEYWEWRRKKKEFNTENLENLENLSINPNIEEEVKNFIKITCKILQVIRLGSPNRLARGLIYRKKPRRKSRRKSRKPTRKPRRKSRRKSRKPTRKSRRKSR